MSRTREITDRRELYFNSMGDILDDVEYLAAGDPPRSAGNWTSAQIVQHVATVIDCSIEGFPAVRATLPVRIICRLLRKRILTTPMKPGLNLPRRFAFLLPESRSTWDEAVDRFRMVLTKLDTQRMTHRSPVLGRVSHEQWVQLHCRHAEMHFSFMHPA